MIQYIRIVIVTIICMFFLSMLGFSQTEKGSWTLGGSFDAHKTAPVAIEADYKAKSFELSPNLGYFFSDNFELGFNASLLKDEYISYRGRSSNSSKSYYFGIYGIQYFGDYKVKPFVGINIKYGFSESYSYSGNKEDYKGYRSENSYREGALMLGVAYIINDYLSVKSYLNLGLSRASSYGFRSRNLEYKSGLEIGFSCYF